MSLRQIRDSYLHLTYFSFPLLFFIYYYLINDSVFFFWIFFPSKLCCCFFCDSIRDPVRDPIHDPIRDLIRDPVRDPVRSDPGFVDAGGRAFSQLGQALTCTEPMSCTFVRWNASPQEALRS